MGIAQKTQKLPGKEEKEQLLGTWLLCTGMHFLLVSSLQYRDLHGVYYIHFAGMDQDSERLTVTGHVSYRRGAQI